MGADRRHFLMIGLPKTGKTTFLAALWHVVKNEDEMPSALKLKMLEGDQEHLNRIHESWLKYNEVARTNPTSEKIVSMDLVGEGEEKSVRMYFPDVSGEQFRQQVEERQCNNNYITLAQKAAGALFFIHSGRIDKPFRINQEESLAQTIRDPAAIKEEPSNKNTRKWNVALVPTQTKLVELLQILMDVADIQRPYRLAIILSAWDLILKTRKTPEEFFEEQSPFFYQYLNANEDKFSFKTYGISAQGGELDKKNLRLRLAERCKIPSERIIVKSEGIDSHDITEPIKWLMEYV